MLTILAVGQDTDLLNTRTAVLRLCNADVISASAFSALEILRDQRLDLVVLCHSLTPKERHELAVIAREHDARVLEVLNIADRGQRSAVDDRVDSNPIALIAKVGAMLSDVVRVP
jgi:DNA-binding response OmpR family regulator